MSETTPERPAVLGRRGEADCIRARTSLAEGRHADALAAVRRARRLRPAEEGPALALAEADALFGLVRHREAVAVATRALRRRPDQDDMEARLRLVRGRGLWLTGPATRAEGELRKAARLSTAPLTRARVLEEQALLASRAGEHETALGHLAQADQIYESAGCAAGAARVLDRRATVLREAGAYEEALSLLDHRIERAQATGRPDVAALARADRGLVLMRLGRWEEARRSLGVATGGDALEADDVIVLGLARAEVDLATGALSRARAVLGTARDLHAERGNTRALAETLLLQSDLELLSGEASAAERIAVESLGLFRLLQDDGGECRSRERRVHALLALGRATEAAREARRAWRAGASGGGLERPDLLVALGRARLRTDRGEAETLFERARTAGAGRRDIAARADAGLAVARAADPADHDVRRALAALEAWGDRRLLARALADVRDVLGRRVDGQVAEGGLAALPRVPMLSAAVDAAEAALGQAAPQARWAAVLKAARAVLPWRRALLVDPAAGGWALGSDDAEPSPLATDDEAVARVRAATGPRVMEAGSSSALAVPAMGGRWAYVELDDPAGGATADEVTLAVLSEFMRLCALGGTDGDPSRDAAAAVPEGEAGDGVETFPGIVGQCPPMRELFRTMARVAASDLVVHVSGETGTGKERVAQALHVRSGRPGTFVAVNASSLSDELVESELFGHVRGAFTGAVSDREGQVVAAAGGTLFLDEVADLSPRVQGKLLRFVETREYSRVGENRVRNADVRLVTAANVPLESRLRPDLIFRLTDVVLGLPPLRERGEDLWRLVRAFLRRHAPPDTPAPVLTAAARRRLESYPWPGNVRELQRVLHRAVVMAQGGPIRPEHLALPAEAPAGAPSSRSLRDAVLACERRHIAEVLGLHRGNRARAAVDLGLTRQGLVGKMARLGIG